MDGFLLLLPGQAAQDTQARDLIRRFDSRESRDEFGILHLGGFPFFQGHEAMISIHHQCVFRCTLITVVTVNVYFCVAAGADRRSYFCTNT
jgi:hypothetical protein